MNKKQYKQILNMLKAYVGYNTGNSPYYLTDSDLHYKIEKLNETRVAEQKGINRIIDSITDFIELLVQHKKYHLLKKQLEKVRDYSNRQLHQSRKEQFMLEHLIDIMDTIISIICNQEYIDVKIDELKNYFEDTL